MTVLNENQMSHNRSQPRTARYTWSSELQYYRKHFSLFYFIWFLVWGIPLYWISQGIELKTKTFILTIALLIVGGLSLTIGYHRLWCHRSFKANKGVQYILAFLGAGQAQWSVLWWARHHRAHHQYTDTNQDPYNARRGFFFTHMGWLLGYNPDTWGPVDISDLENDPVVIWQHRYYIPLALTCGAVLPTIIAYYGWNDWKGGLIYGCCIRMVVVMHSTFMVNSVAHSSWAGTQPYSNATTARNVPLLRVWSLGEGNHNFHHTFPSDYRNGVLWYEHDPSRWVILALSKLGLASGLKVTSDQEIERACQSQIGHRPKPNDCIEMSSLPQIDWSEYVDQVEEGHALICIEGMVYDATTFIDAHPGGRNLIQQAVGADGTAMFYGQHFHSPHAETILKSLRVARVVRQRDLQQGFRVGEVSKTSGMNIFG